MSTYIRCEAVLVPASHYAAIDGSSALQVHLSFDIISEPNPHGHVARERFEKFLGRAPTMEFRLCTVGEPNADASVLLRIGDHLQPDTKGVFGWLVARDPRWQWHPADDDAWLSAGQLLAASAGWEPHTARATGLAATLMLPAGETGETLANKILLPFPAGCTPGTVTWEQDAENDTLVTKTYAVYPINEIGERFRVEVFPIPIGLPNDNPLVDPGTGLLRTPGDQADEKAHQVYEMLGTFGLRGASQLASAHALLGVTWPATGAEDKDRAYNRVMYHGVATLAALLDPIMLSLVMPGSPGDGPFIGAMMAALEDDLAENGTKLPDKTVDLTVTKLQERIAAHLALPNTAVETRKEFVERLKAVLAAAPGPDEEMGTPIWQDVLDQFAYWNPGSPWSPVANLKGLSPTEIAERLAVDLARLLQWLESEDGCEKVALKLIEACLPSNGDGEIIKEHKDNAIALLTERMKGDFNGADAARMAVGTLLVDALVAAAKLLGGEFWSVADLRAALALFKPPTENWFVARLWPYARAGNPFAALLDALPTLGPGVLHHDDGLAIRDQLTKAWHDVQPSLLGNSDERRFEDSKVPLPLPVRINADADIERGDDFAKHYAGLGVLIRRAGEAWAHANLATKAQPLKADGTVPVEGVPLWVEPLSPAAVNGRQELFKDYQGLPFFEADFDAQPGGKPAAEFKPYYSIDAPTGAALSSAGLTGLPALAYGVTYEVAAFAILRGGLLPRVLADPGQPWKPLGGTLEVAADHIARRVYSRTTSIGAVQFAGEGLSYPQEAGSGVQPLADDYPRRGLASQGETAWFELWRNSDGSGLIAVPADGETIVLTLDDVVGWQGGGIIGIHIASDPSAVMPETAPPLQAKFAAPFAGGRLELGIANRGGTITYRLQLAGADDIERAEYVSPPGVVGRDPGAPVFAWLSLKADQQCALSFADPVQAQSGDTPASNRPKVMLAAPSKGFVTPAGKTEITFTLDYPRVPLLDFERWLNNPALANELGLPDAADSENTPAKKLKRLLLEASLTDTLSDQAPKFPDPAVRHLLVELTPLDGLADDPANLAKNRHARREIIPLASFDQLGQAQSLEALFKTIDDLFHAEWKIKAGEIFWIDQVKRTVTVPEGMTAELSVRPLVRDSLFTGASPVIDPRLLQRAQGSLLKDGAKLHLFDGPRRVIEMMSVFSAKNFADRAFVFVGVRSIGTSRAYDLLATPPSPKPEDWQWRRFASAEVKVQQWRFMGRPIKQWIDPKTFATDDVQGCAAIRLDKTEEDDAEALLAFEAEAFLDRDDDDAQLYTVRLAPLDLGGQKRGLASTVLHTFEWPDASATMVRHRLALFSRYLGALAKPSDGRLEVIGADTNPKWLRVVFLADLTRLTLTRPQLRALIPLTIADDIASTPPIMALLDEAPFVHGGLAGRIAASIRTGLGFAVLESAQQDSNQLLELEDARAEFGPDPQLRYTPTCILAARALTLLPEGPIGLTFDDPSIRSAVFANSAVILTPHVLSAAGDKAESDLQEHFASVALRRYIDPRWLVDPAPPTNEEGHPANQCWWIECQGTDTLKHGEDALCTVTLNAGHWLVDIANRKFVFNSGTNAKPLELVRIDKNRASGIALLHQPLANGRASLTVFALPSKDAIKEGIAGTPLALASVEWSAPGPASNEFLSLEKRLSAGPKTTFYRAAASAETPMNWGRTARDSDSVLIADDTEDGKPTSIHMSKLAIVLNEGAIRPWASQSGKRYHLRPPHEDSKVVLEVQRHLAVIRTRPLKGSGQMIETIDSAKKNASLIMGSALPLKGAAVGDRVRIVVMEVKAVPVAAAKGTVPDEYRRAVFDLPAIGRGDKDAFVFFIRPVGEYRKFGANFELRFELLWPHSPDPVRQQITLSPSDGEDLTCRTIVMCADGTDVLAWFLTDNGECVPAHSTITIKNTDAKADSEVISISGLAVSNDSRSIPTWWADIAMLSLKTMPIAKADQPELPLDFDWLFTSTLASPADAVGPASLNTMTEVEARIIGVSAPITISE